MPGLFRQNTIAVIWDFDKTLTPDYMEEPLFRKFGIESKEFWNNVKSLEQSYLEKVGLVSKDTLYLDMILAYVRDGLFAGLTNRGLRELGAQIGFYDGLPGFLKTAKDFPATVPEFLRHDIAVEHYVVSTGLRQMILGSGVSPYVDGVWGCEFAESVPSPKVGMATDREGENEIAALAYVLDNTTKTRAIFEINKGTNRNPTIDVNASIHEEDRRVPFQNMIYVADGPSDVPVFSIINSKGGKTFGVYKPGSLEEFRQMDALQRQGRVQSYGPADYTERSQAHMWILNAVRQIADRIVRNRENYLAEHVGVPPQHLAETSLGRERQGRLTEFAAESSNPSQ